VALALSKLAAHITRFALTLISSIKGKVKKKNLSRGWNFSTFAAHFIEQDLF
jgi:hypothetical protein